MVVEGFSETFFSVEIFWCYVSFIIFDTLDFTQEYWEYLGDSREIRTECEDITYLVVTAQSFTFLGWI